MIKEEKNKEKTKEKKKRTPLQRIVNAFLYTCIGLLILFLILLGISQTSTFREYLRETLIEEANSALNGKLYIERIDGTIFTSVILHNVSVNMEEDTLFKSEKIELMTSPLQLLLKTIFIRHFEIQNASISLTTDESGNLNFTKLFPPSEEPDTPPSEFNFIIHLANVQLKNVNISLKDYSVKNPASYEEFNFNDFAVNNLNLKLEANLDINKNIYEMNLDHLSFKTSVNGFNVNEIEGDFFLSDKNIVAKDLFLKTGRSELMISAAVKNLNLFDTAGINFEKANFNFEAGSEQFSFSDVKPFAPSLSMLEGNIEFGLNTSGTINRLSVNRMYVLLENSQIGGTAELRNLLDENLLISADVSGSYIDQSDIKNLFAGLNLPVYPEYGVIRFDTLTYNGSPLDFKSNINVLTDKGNVTALINLDLREELIQYDVNLKTDKVDIEPVSGIKSSLNISADINGKGVSPETFDGTVKLFANGSSINGKSIDTLRLSSDAKDKSINFDFRLVLNETIADLIGNFDFKPEEPSYSFKGNLNNLNLAQFIQDTTLRSNFNLTLDAEGNGFDPDSIDMFLTATMHSSKLNDLLIDTTRLIVDLRSDPGNRVVNIISDLADLTITGDYKVDQAVDLIVSEMTLVSEAFNEKMNYFFPSVGKEEVKERAGLKNKKTLFTEINEPVKLDYLIELKDFSLISAFIGNYNLNVDAEMGGSFQTTEDNNVLFTFNTDLKHIKLYNDNEAYFISNMLLDLNVQNSFSAVSSSDVDLNFTTSSEHILAGTEVYDFNFSIDMKNDNAELKLSVKPEPYFAKLISKIDLSRGKIDVTVDSLILAMDDFRVQNKNDLIFSYDGDRIQVNQFKLIRGNSELNINGQLSQTGEQDFNINFKNWSGKDLSVNLMNIRQENSADASIDLDAKIKGSFVSPVIDGKLLVDSIIYGNKKFGELNSTFKYSNKNLDVNLAFLDSTLNKNDAALTVDGYVPIDLSFSGSEENYMETKPMRINLKSSGFNLAAFGDILPSVNRLRGEFTSDITISGTPSSLTTNGFIKVVDASFFLEANNLEYNASLLVNIDGEDLKLDSFVIANVPGTENGGKITGSGIASLDNFEVTSSSFSFNGDLKVLSEASKAVSPSIYGELVIGTDGNAEINITEERIYIYAPVLIKQANLTFPQTQSAYASGSENYVYKFPPDTITMVSASGDLDFKELVEISEHGKGAQQSKSKSSILDYNINVKIEDEAKVTYVLSKEFDQNLIALLAGDITLRKSGSRTDVSGEFDLLEGSTLQFIKTLETEGSINFRSGEISNPELDLVATYSSYHYPTDGPFAGEEVPVEVRLFIKGPLKDLDKNLSTGKDKLKVYYGAKNIADNNAAPDRDASDAVMFILRDEFLGDDPQNKNEVANLASSVAGSYLGNFLNQQFGDAVRTVQLRQVGSATVVSLVGRAGKFRYEIGTSTDVYQDLSRANVKIQYPVTKNFYLRVERKESINRESTYTTEMINEVGIKYLFEF